MSCLRIFLRLHRQEHLQKEAKGKRRSLLGAVAHDYLGALCPPLFVPVAHQMLNPSSCTQWELYRFSTAYGNAFRLSNCLDVGWQPLLPRFAALFPVEADLYLVFPNSLYCEQY